MWGFYKNKFAVVLSLGALVLVSACGAASPKENCDQRGSYRYDACMASAIEGRISFKECDKLASGGVIAPKFAPLFSTPLRSSSDRFKRIENEVQKLRDEFDKANIKPALATDAPAATTGQKPVALVKAAATKPATASIVKGLRLADHADKTRIVLDMTGKRQLKASLGKDAKSLVVELGDASWSAKKEWLATKGSLVSGYKVDGGKLVVSLLYPAKITLSAAVNPVAPSKYYRFVIDLVSSDVHKH